MAESVTDYFIAAHLKQGYIDTWLVAGPHVVQVANLERYTGADYKTQLFGDLYDSASGIAETPIEFTELTVGQATQRWQYYRCRDDHFVDLSGFYHLTSYLQSWAYAELIVPAARRVAFVLTSNAPADVWINGRHVHRQDHIQHQIPLSATFEAELDADANTILVRFEAIAARECPYVMALQLRDDANSALPDLPVRLPTGHQHGEFHTKLERLFAAAYLERDVYCRDDEIVVIWPEDLPAELRQTITVRLQDVAGRIYYEGLVDTIAGARQSVGRAVQYLDNAYQIVLMPHPNTYYLTNIRVTRSIALTILKNRYSDTPYGEYATRRQEALLDAAMRRDQIYAEIAKMELGQWPELNQAVIQTTIDGINQRRDCSDFYLIGLLGALIRYGNDPQFPKELEEQIRLCALGFRYWAADPGADAMWFWSENHQILFHACEVLAGQLFAAEIFDNTDQSGTWHAERGTAFSLAWLHKRASGGFREWDSNCYFEHDLLALTHLADLAENEQLRELAAVVSDKLLFSMALNSFHGVFGSTHGRTYTDHIKGARRELTSGIGRMLWGTGVFNQHILGTVALACAKSYELPSVIAEIATARVEELWSKERHRQELTWEYDRVDGILEVNKATYRTPDYMLCSAQDHNPGQLGSQQHIWQATLSQDALVFVTHPPCVSEEGSHRPGFWHGNVVLPRVAQWYDTLIDVRNMPKDDWMGFTHAFFPTFAFDRHAIHSGWAFAQVGDGYLAITAANGIALVTHGDNAHRELRSYGTQNIWVCQMGRAARDGDFEAFQERVLSLGTEFGELSVRCGNLRGQELRFGWHGPLLVNGVEQPLSGFKHYESPICTCDLGDETMDIAGWQEIVQLNFAV